VTVDVVIRCRALSRSFGAVLAVDNVDLEVRRGRVLALIGPSGCGKTTTLRLIAGFEEPESGRIELDGEVVAEGSRSLPPERRRVGMVFQDYALFPHLDVAGNVAFGLPPGPGRAQRVQAILDLVGLSGLGRRYPHALSGGQQQRVALARALAPAPALLLLDEPFSNLDAALRGRVRSDVREILERAGATAILVTHDQDEALSIADDVAVMQHGRILQTGTPEDIYNRPRDRDVALLLGEANLVPGDANEEAVWTELGPLVSSDRAVSGPIEAVVRPEAICLEPDADGDAEVERREFFGHDQRLVVRVGTGRRVIVRLGPRPSFHVGDHVRLFVQGPVALLRNDA
jgi:iron(III) transport system ATP-binding protein